MLVRGEAASFCAGGDISEYPDFRFDESALRDFHENDVWGGLAAMLDCDVPVVAQIALRALAQGRQPHQPYRYADSGEHREGIAAFLEKRKPAF